MPIAGQSRRCRKTSAASIPASHRHGIERRQRAGKKNGPVSGAISMCALVPVVMVALHHHDLVAVMMPAAMPAIVAMLAEFGASAVGAVIVPFDDHGLGVRDRRRNDREGA